MMPKDTVYIYIISTFVWNYHVLKQVCVNITDKNKTDSKSPQIHAYKYL